MPDIDIRVHGHAGRITLDRPRALNALTLPMVHAIAAALADWAHDPAIRLVIIDGAGGRALCAGGDIRALYEGLRAGQIDEAGEFFAAEYAMNGQIAAFPKPYVALMDGLVMGGGVGVSAHGDVRIVTERTSLAMPETGIGLFPDVGATWLLSRHLPIGLHLALTGARIGAADAIAAGLADFFVPSEHLPALTSDLCDCTNKASILAAIGARCPPPPKPEISGAWLQDCYSEPTMEAIVLALLAHPHPAAPAAAHEIAGKSPSSLKVTLRALREAAGMADLHQALAQELVLAKSCLRSHDFTEGVRAAIIDKDRSPAWNPTTLSAVTPATVDSYFA